MKRILRNKKFLICGIALIAILIMIKICQFLIVKNILIKIDNFKNEDNRIYSVEIIENGKSLSENVYLKNEVMKYLRIQENEAIYCEWFDAKNNQKYSIDLQDKILYDYELWTDFRIDLCNLPNMISQRKFTINNLLEIYYIIPTTYNNEKAIKIKTKTEEIIIDSNTYLPICSFKTKINSKENKKEKIKYIYKFEVGNVSDEDIALPDLSEYEISN